MYAGALLALLAAPGVGCGSGYASDWPVEGDPSSHTIAGTFGPRLTGGDYDFHRGVDILTTLGEPVHPIARGVVKVAGDDPDYEPDTVVLRHCFDEPWPADLDDCNHPFFSHYSHLASIEISSGQTLQRGALIGLSGQGDSGIAHVHFEIRDGGPSKSYAIHPLRMLPYPDKGPPSVTVMAADLTDPENVEVSLSVAVAAEEVDLARVEIELQDAASGAVLSRQEFDLEEWNDVYSDTIDQPTQGGVTVEPIDFDRGHPSKIVNFHFHDLVVANPSEPVRVVARALDVMGNVAEVVE